VTTDDVRAAARLALPHRRRRNPFDAPGLDEEQLEQALQDAAEEPEPDPDGPGGGAPDPGEAAPSTDSASTDSESSVPPTGSGSQPPAAPSPTFRTRHLEVAGVGSGAPGRRSKAESVHGLTTRAAVPTGTARRIHLTATLQAAAPHQRARGRRPGSGLLLRRDDLRDTVREGREGNLVLFVVDASGSMAARSRMAAVKGAVLSLLLDAYQRRDKVGMVTFRGADAELVLPPTSSVEAAAARLRALATGGRTPLSAGLTLAWQTVERERLRDPNRRPLLVVVTDGRHTSGTDPADVARVFAARGLTSVVVDCESGPVRLGMAARLAANLGGTCLALGDLAAESLAETVRAIKAVA
jgi:magnesium chelatase subunit D